MADRQSLEELVDALPIWSGDPFVEQEPSLAFIEKPFPGGGYVWPDIIPRTNVNQARVLMMTAPGAMGKSSAAHAIARKANVPLIDVSRMPVGQHSLTGLLFDSLGYDIAPTYIQAIQLGEACLVIDGLDEAQLRSGREHYFAFVEDLTRMMRAATKNCQVVLLGRHDAMESAQLQFLEGGLDCTSVEIAPLSYTQSIELINNTLDNQSGRSSTYEIHRIHPGPFGEWRDYVLLALAEALEPLGEGAIEDRWQEVESFLGYPPVLLVLAERLAVQNPAAEPRDGFSDSNSQRGEILQQVIEAILQRESEKVQKLLVPALEWAPDDPRIATLYLPEEQSMRICDFLSNRSGRIVTPAQLTEPERQIYTDQISSFLPDHPFLRDRKPASIVFSDYLRAYVGHSAISEIHGISQIDIKQAFPTIGPFLCHFLYSLSKGVHRSQVGVIGEDLVDDAIHSFIAGPSADSAFVYTQASDGHSPHLRLIEDIHNAKDCLVYHVSDPSGILELSSPIRRGAVFTSGGIIFSASDSGEISIGSECVFFAQAMEFVGRAVEFPLADPSSRSSAAPTYLVCQTTPTHPSDIKVNVYQSGSLQISWPDPTYQWREHLASHLFEVPNIREDQATRILIAVRRIFLAFKASSSGDPAIYYEFLENNVVGEDPAFKVALDVLTRLGFVRRESQSYCLCRDRLSEYGINYASLRNPGFETALRPLVAAVCKDDAIQAWASGGN